MSALRTMTCPACGRRHLIGGPCPTAETARAKGMVWHTRLVLSMVVIGMTAAGLTAAALAAAEAWGNARAAVLLLGLWIVLQLLRLGYEYDDGIDIKELLLPAPFDWSVKIERTIHFWTSLSTWFRSVYLGTLIALAIFSIQLAAK